MSKIAVKRFAGGDDGRDIKHYLTLLSPENPNAFEHLDLPIPIDIDYKLIRACTCRGLLCISDYAGNSVICNPTTRQFKLLPRPDLEPSPDYAIFDAYGLGYDAKSDDFKVLRCFLQYYSRPSRDTTIIHYEYLGCKQRSQLYSFRSNAWKDIAVVPELGIESDGVYIEGTSSCYFLSGLSDDVWCFDFEDEAFDRHFALPPKTSSDEVLYRLVECGGLLGVIRFPRPYDKYTRYPEPRSSGTDHITTFEIFVRRGGSWDKLHEVSLTDVWRPLGIRYGRFFYVEAESINREQCQLTVFDLSTNDWKKLNIYDRRGHLDVLCYDESMVPLPGAVPMRESTRTETRTSKDEEVDSEH